MHRLESIQGPVPPWQKEEDNDDDGDGDDDDDDDDDNDGDDGDGLMMGIEQTKPGQTCFIKTLGWKLFEIKERETFFGLNIASSMLFPAPTKRGFSTLKSKKRKGLKNLKHVNVDVVPCQPGVIQAFSGRETRFRSSDQ